MPPTSISVPPAPRAPAAPPVTLESLVQAICSVLDLGGQHGLVNHHQRVTALAVRVGSEAGLCEAASERLALAAALHDLGTSGERERAALASFDVLATDPHCAQGAALCQRSGLLADIAPIIRSHHDRFGELNPSGLEGERIPLEARVLHLCDRVDVLLERGEPALPQRRRILERMEPLVGRIFDPAVWAAFVSVARRESAWLELSFAAEAGSRALGSGTSPPLGPHALEGLTRLLGDLLDSRSPFTSRHSAHVALVADALASRAGVPEENRGELVIAALLHDLGKVGVPDPILAKPGALSEEEMELVRQHPYFTWQILRSVAGFERVARWAAQHHERVDGNGYPFHVGGAELDVEARIIAVSDVFAALAETRPYRAALPPEAIGRILRENADSGGLCPQVVSLAMEALGPLHAAVGENDRRAFARSAARGVQALAATA